MICPCGKERCPWGPKSEESDPNATLANEVPRIQRLWIPGRLPGQNEMIKAAKSGRGKGNAYSREKSAYTGTVTARALEQVIRPVARASVRFVWHEPNRRRDPDNLTCGQKFVFDGLVQANVLTDDGWDEVEAISHSWKVSKTPGVEVFITEVL